MSNRVVLLAILILAPLAAFTATARADPLPKWIMACSESEIHQKTVACYNGCISQYFDEQRKQACIQGCVATQDNERAACPSITCKMIGGYKICS